MITIYLNGKPGWPACYNYSPLFTCLYLPCATQASDYQQWNSQDSEDTWAQHGTLSLWEFLHKTQKYLGEDGGMLPENLRL